jgi:hypothetical protein
MKHSNFYFPHEQGYRNNSSIRGLRKRFGAEGFGVLMMLKEVLAEDSSGQMSREFIPELASEFGIGQDKLTEIIDYCIGSGVFGMTEQGDFFATDIIAHHELLARLSERGKRGAMARWNNA